MNTLYPILVVDDDQAWLNALSEYLRQKGFSVLAAHDAGEGLALLAIHPVSVVVCDYRMPGMDGLAFIERLQQQQNHVGILMLSNEEEPTLAARALAAGAGSFAAKTLAPPSLLRQVQQLINAVAAAATAGSTLHLWQRLLPSPQKSGGSREQGRNPSPAPKKGRRRS